MIAEDSSRKLFYIEKACEGKNLIVKLISEKRYMERQELTAGSIKRVYADHCHHLFQELS